MGKLVDLIINSAPARIPAPMGLSPEEEQMVEQMVEGYIRPYAEKLATSNAVRSEFRLNVDMSKVLESLFTLDLFSGNKAKIAEARKKAKGLFTDWERLIQHSEMLASLRKSQDRLKDEVSSDGH